ncbi:MAG: EVE domain-containing protein [Verrucomicrobia bacterium]|nr:EVE domain-containing protein [Verrucomicrobiota bacterium]
MQHWLIKSEPSECAFVDLQRRGKRSESWSGVRNYQARNFMRTMQLGNLALFYHSSCLEPGVVGVVAITRTAYPDPTAWDKASPYFDARSSPGNPLWDMVDIRWHTDFSTFVSLDTLRADNALQDLLILRRGNRLSITPVTATHFKRICALGA